MMKSCFQRLIVRTLLSSGTLAALLISTAGHAFAFDGYVSTVGKTSVTVTVNNLSTVSGWGAHVSGSPSEDGFGGTEAECYILQSGNNLVVQCYDGYQDASNAQNFFRLELGPKSELSHAVFTYTQRGVKVEAVRLTTNLYTPEKYAYSTEGFFPIRQSSGFWRTGNLYYQANTVLAGPSTGRTGSGYSPLSVVAR
jgi:hypothetical protein